jgi:hypothetical protein
MLFIPKINGWVIHLVLAIEKLEHIALMKVKNQGMGR